MANAVVAIFIMNSNVAKSDAKSDGALAGTGNEEGMASWSHSAPKFHAIAQTITPMKIIRAQFFRRSRPIAAMNVMTATDQKRIARIRGFSKKKRMTLGICWNSAGKRLAWRDLSDEKNIIAMAI